MSGFSLDNKVRIFYDPNTTEAGLQIKLTNKTGSNSVKGDVVEPSDSTNRAFALSPVNSLAPCGIVYEAGIADGEECWIWQTGCVQVRYQAATTRGFYGRVTVTADTDDAPGVAIAEALPSSPFATDKHFQELGQVNESIGGAGLALTIIHFN